MAVLKTQSSYLNTIKFYHKNGFKIIGFDLYAYLNEDTEKHKTESKRAVLNNIKQSVKKYFRASQKTTF